MPLATVMPTPNVLQDPGYIYHAPMLTTLPTNTVAGSVFTDAWPAGWVLMGGTEDGNQWNHETTVEPVRVAELFYAIRYSTTDIATSLAFTICDITLTNMRKTMNAGPGSVVIVSGTGATQLNKLTPPTPGAIVRAMIGWESLDATMRIILYQCLNGGNIQASMRRAPAKMGLACNWNAEKPTATEPFDVWSAGAGRA